MSVPPTTAPRRAPARPASPTVYVMTGRAVLALIGVEFALAGVGAFSGLSGGDAADSRWALHEGAGYLIALFTVVLVVLAAVLRLGAVTVRRTAVTAVLAVFGQPVLAVLGSHVSPWFGMLHALNALVIAAVLGILTARAGRSPGTGEPRG